MLRRILNVLSQLGTIMCVYVLVVHAQDTQGVSVDYENHGSIPPVSDWYACGRRLNGLQSYDPAEGKKCLKEILSHGHFKSGRIKVSSTAYGRLVTFVLESPSLKLTHMDYGIRNELKSEFHDYLASTNFIPRLGDIYDVRSEGSTTGRIESFFASKGFRVAVSKKNRFEL
jgi:hypothetical protein